MPPNTYLSSWELAAMRDLRVLSARGHPDTLQRERKKKKRHSVDMDEPTHGCPGFVIYIQFWVMRNGKEWTGIGSGFTVKEHGLMGISVICCNQQWSAVRSHCGTSNKSFSFKPLAKGQQMPSARKQKREPLTLLSSTSTLIYLFRIRDATSTSERPPFFLCCLGGVRACHEPRVGL